MDWVRLDFARFPAQRLHARNGLLAKVILTYAAGNNSLVPQEARDVGKICRSAAELLAEGKHVPQKFAKSDDDAAIHVSNSLSTKPAQSYARRGIGNTEFSREDSWWLISTQNQASRWKAI